MKTVTITSQGQITIPASVREAWGLRGSEKLNINYDEESGRLTIEKPMTVDEVTRRLRSLRVARVEPLTDVHDFYQSERLNDIVSDAKDCQ